MDMDNYGAGLADSGTYDLTGSIRKPNLQHIDNFGGQQNYLNNSQGNMNFSRANEQHMGLLESKGRINLASDRASEHRESKPDPFNLSSASLKLTSGARGGKYA